MLKEMQVNDSISYKKIKYPNLGKGFVNPYAIPQELIGEQVNFQVEGNF
jgi:hypothetical protein